MAQRPKRGLKADIKAPLIMAAVLAVVAFLGVFVFATGGTNNRPEIELALAAGGGVFVVTLVVCATLIMVERPNDEELGQGTGVNRRSADLYAAAKARKEEREAQRRREEAQAEAQATGDEAAETEQGRPDYGERAHPEDHN